MGSSRARDRLPAVHLFYPFNVVPALLATFHAGGQRLLLGGWSRWSLRPLQGLLRTGRTCGDWKCVYCLVYSRLRFVAIFSEKETDFLFNDRLCERANKKK